MFAKLFEFIAWLHGGGKTPEQVCREWHSFLIGWAEMFCFSIPSRFPITELAKQEMEKESHYYEVGRGVGVASWVVIVMVVFA